jgi:hypothetical protein
MFDCFANCPNLSVLEFKNAHSGVFSLTDEDLNVLSTHCGKLRSLKLVNATLHGSTELALRFPCLTDIDLDLVAVHDLTLASILRSSCAIRILKLWNISGVNKHSMACIGPYTPNLETLSLCPRDIRMDAKLMMRLGRHCPQLRSLTLYDQVTASDQHLIALAQECRKLQQLRLSKSKITDASLSALAACCPELVYVQLCGCLDVSGEAEIALRKACPRLDILYVINAKST